MSAATPARRGRRSTLPVVCLATLATAGVLFWLGPPRATTGHEERSEDLSGFTTVPVERGTLTDQLRLTGTLGHGEPLPVPTSPRVVTALPGPGEVIDVGSAVYEADGRPVILLEGDRPFWRDLTSGMDRGQDVLQLEQNLARLGFFDREPDTRFDWWTAEAIKTWQRDLGVPVTGTVAVADVLAVDGPGLRVAQLTGELGDSGVSPLAYTATTLRAVATLTAAQSRELQADAPVTVLLPDGTEVETSLTAVDPGGQPTQEEGQATPARAIIEFPDQDVVAGAGPGTVQVIVQQQGDTPETLIVPATALIATAPDTYAVDVRTDDGLVRLPVEIGAAADARVQILTSGPDADGAPGDAPVLSAGDEVVTSR